MRSYYTLALRQLRTRRLRVLLTAAGIVLGVGMICGVLLLAATIQRTFTDLYDSVYGETDLVVSGAESTGSLPPSALDRARGIEGVEQASGNVFAVLSLIGEDGKVDDGPGSTLNTSGIEPGSDLTDSRVTQGREIEGGREIQVEESWAESNGVEAGETVELAAPSGVVEFEVVGLFKFSNGLDFGGEGFGTLPLPAAREAFDRPKAFDEVQVVVESDDEPSIEAVRSRLKTEFGKGVDVATPAVQGRGHPEPAAGAEHRPLLLRRDGAVRWRLPDLQQLQHDRASADARDRDAADAWSHPADDRALGPAEAARWA